MIAACVSSYVIALEVFFLENLNPVRVQWFIKGGIYEDSAGLQPASQSVMATSYDWVSTVSIVLIVLTYILITVLVVLLVRKGMVGKSQLSSSTGTNESNPSLGKHVNNEDYTAQKTSLFNVASKVSPNIKQWKEVKQQVESSELSPNLQSRYLSALDHFDKRRFEEVGHMAKRDLTETDKRYMICFIVGMSITDIATIFHVEPTSLYTMKYRLKKKFPPELIDYIEFL